MSAESIALLQRATLRLLENTGISIGSERALECLRQAGVPVDSASRAYPGKKHIDQALRTAPKSFSAYDRRTDHSLLFDGAETYFLSGGSSLNVQDLQGRYGPAKLEHLHQFNRLLDALPHIHMLINQVDPEEFTGKELYRLVAAEMLIDTTKPVFLQAADDRDVAAFVEMGAVIRGSREALATRPLFFVGMNAEPPLAIAAGIADALLACCSAGIPCSLGNYNMMGITAPRTVAGAVVQLNALQLTAIVLAQACNPGASIFYTAFSGSGNLKTLDPLCADPLSVQEQRLATRLGRSYLLPVYSFAGTDSRWPDAQAACEHAYQFQTAIESGCSLLQGPTSMMDQMMLSSFAQTMIDHDIIDYILACRVEPRVTEEDLALDIIHEVVTDPGFKELKFAAHPHTVQHLDKGRWAPQAFAYESRTAWEREGSKTIEQKALESAQRIVAEHQPDPLPPAEAAAIRSIAGS